MTFFDIIKIRRRALVAAIGICTLLPMVAACSEQSPRNDAQSTGQQQTEHAFAQQQAAQPYPAAALTDSLERKNVSKRLLRYNNANKIGYIYLLTDTGGIYTYYTIKGKVSSTDSQMTTTDLIQSRCHDNNVCNDVTVPAPGDDGSYGPNEPGIFFFTSDDVLVTWNGKYLLTDAPMKISSQNLVLTYQEGSKPTQ